MQPTLVGRGDDLARLTTLVGSAAAGAGGTALVVGEAGMGKTALVTALLERVGDEVAPAVGPCSPGGAGRLPFAPWTEIVAALDRCATELAIEVPDGVRRAVSPLLRPWDATGAEVGSPTAMFAAVTDLVGRVAARRPVLVVVEDAHWADASSLDLLAHVGRRAPRTRLAVVVTGRPTPVGHLHEFARSATVPLVLAPLTDVDVVDVIRGAGGDDVDPADQARIVRLAEGNPFLALHLLRRSTVAGSNDDVDVLGVRRAVADPDAARLLVRLALVRDDVPDDVLAAAARLSTGRRLAVTRALVDDGLLTTVGDRLRFRHALIREEVTSLATPAEITAAHADLVDALEGLLDDSRAAELAQHQLGAGRWGAGLRSLLRAADHADRVHARREAQDALTAARRMWPRVPTAAAALGTTYPDLLTRLGRTARGRGDFAVAHAAWDEIADHPHDAADLAYERALTHFLDGSRTLAVEGFARADTLLGPSTTVPRPQILAARARALLTQHDFAAAHEAAARALTIADDPRVRVDIRITSAMAGRMAERSDRPALAELTACATAARDLGAVDLVLRSYGGLLNLAFNAARFEEVLRLADELRHVCAPYATVPMLTSIVAPFEVESLRCLGRWDDAVRCADSAVDDAGFREIAADLHLMVALVAADRGDWPEAERRLQQAETGRHADEITAATLLAVRTRLLLHRGDVHAAIEAVRSAVLTWTTTVALSAPGAFRTAWSVLAAAPTVPADVAADLDRMTSATPGEVVTARPWVHGLHLLAAAERARVYYDPDEAMHWATVIGLLRELDWRAELAPALLRLAEALARSRRMAEAGRVAHEARALADELGAATMRAAVDRLLSLLGDPPAPDTGVEPGRPMGLTRREVQVLDLLTQGATNREIGRTLFISERTAAVHVSNIIGKLGVRNRTQAAQAGSRLATD